MSRRMCSAVRMTVPVILAVIVFALAAPASAAPLEPTLGLADLRAELAAAPGGVLPGYFKTVLRGSAIENIPCDILAVTGGPTDELDPTRALILFEARGPVIERLGGVASGMSGSPVYVTVRGQDRLVGALAYGDVFTRNGAALATPIEAMAAIESLSAGASVSLASPVVCDSRSIDRIVVTDDAPVARLVAATGGLPVKRLAALYIGGVSPACAPYRAFAATATRHGLDVVPLASALGTGNERFTAALTPGASVAALAARGDLWVGGVGTVTYVNGGRLVAFGHPLVGEGETGLFLHNAWVDGVWPSLAAPYKLATPGALRGTFVQDRWAGIMGVTPSTPDEVVVRSSARRSDTGAASTSHVALSSFVVNSWSPIWQGIVPFSATVAPVKVYDSVLAPGSAMTTTTVTVTNGRDVFNITRSNVFDSKYSVPNECAMDLSTITGRLAEFAAEGREPVRITSVELTSTISATRTSARVADVSVPGGLTAGDNTVRIALRQTGVAATRTVEVTLSIPAGTPLDGALTVAGSGGVPGSGETPEGDGQSTAPESLAELVALLNAAAPNDLITVSYAPQPGGSSEERDGGSDESPRIEARLRTGFVVTGQVTKQATAIRATVQPARPTAGQAPVLAGSVAGAARGVVEVWLRQYGEVDESLVATSPLDGAGALGTFEAALPALTKTSRVRIEYLGGPDSLGTSRSLTVPVRAKVSLSANMSPRAGAPLTLSARVIPGDFGGSIVFERRAGRAWRAIATVPAPAGVARFRFTPTTPTTVRARAIGSPSNAPGVSPALTIRPRS